jgi:hypothetical protein
MLSGALPGTRSIVEVYTVSHGRAVTGLLGVASERIGEAPTLKGAKAMAQRHHDARR